MRSRNIKPGFFKNDELGQLSPLARLLFIGLWCAADCNGNLEYRPARLAVEILPYDDCDIEALINELRQSGFVVQYRIQTGPSAGLYLSIPRFLKHQSPHKKERDAGSEIPMMPAGWSDPGLDPTQHGASRADSGFRIADCGYPNPDCGYPETGASPDPEPDAHNLDPLASQFDGSRQWHDDTFWPAFIKAHRGPNGPGSPTASRNACGNSLLTADERDAAMAYIDKRAQADKGNENPPYWPSGSKFFDKRQWEAPIVANQNETPIERMRRELKEREARNA